MDFNFSEDQVAIRDSMERIFNDLCSDDAIKGLAKDAKGGGAMLSLVELCLVIEQQGRCVAPVPLIASVVESAMTIAEGDNQSLAEELLPKTVAGEMLLSPARPYTGIQNAKPLTATNSENAWVINGRSGFVPYAAHANGFVVQANDENNNDVLIFCPASQAGVSVIPQVSISDEPAGYLSFSSVMLDSNNLIAHGELASQLITKQRQRTWIALAAMQVGALDAGIKRMAEYVSERKQFGRALGSFQAVSQQAADAYMEVECLRSVYWRALDDIQSGADCSISAAVTKYWVAEAGHKAAHAVLHLHGGIGQDLDYPIHRYFLFAKQCERYLGSADTVSAELGKVLMRANAQVLEDLCQ